jgi:hypothetical protein
MGFVETLRFQGLQVRSVALPPLEKEEVDCYELNGTEHNDFLQTLGKTCNALCRHFLSFIGYVWLSSLLAGSGKRTKLE